MFHFYKYPRAALTVDIILFKEITDSLDVLLIKRANNPFKNYWALPGGFLDMNETLEQAALRELEEETGVKNVLLKQFYTFSDINRDPRHRTVSTVFYGFVKNEIFIKNNSDACDAKWFNINELPDLAFDHSLIIEKAKNEILLK